MKIAIVTGASSGIGNTFVERLDTKKLDEIWVIARREERLHELKNKCTTHIRIFAMDLLQESALKVIDFLLKEEHPEIKYLVNAAGFGVFGQYTMDLYTVNRMIDLNIKALVNMTYMCIPYMKKGSQIIQLGSVSSFTPLMNFNIYASTKAFVIHFSNALRQELKPEGINVCVVCPGWVQTEFFKHANKNNTKYAPRFCWPMYQCEFVVKKALSASEKGRMSVIPGIFPKVHYTSSKLLPKKILMQIWKSVQK